MSKIKREPLSFPAKMRAVLRTNGKCPYCEIPLSVANEYGARTHFDHMQPLSRGGTNDDSNIIACCADCNIRKGSKTVFEFMCERMGIEIPVWAHLNPGWDDEDWSDTDTLYAGCHDAADADCDADVADDGIDAEEEIEDAPPPALQAADPLEDDPETEPPLYSGPLKDGGDEPSAWMPLGQALLGALNQMERGQ